MVRTDSSSVVSDAGPIIHLDELQSLDLLGSFGQIFVPREVWAEVAEHRPQLKVGALPDVRVVAVPAKPSARLLSLCDSLQLDAGEVAALTLMESITARQFLSDDSAARLAAESLGFTVHGAVGIIVRSIRTADRTSEQALALLRDIPRRSSLHISRQLLSQVIAQIERTSSD